MWGLPRSTLKHRVAVCPGHSITMDKIKGLATTATRYGADAPFEPWVPGESDGDGVVSPGESLRTVANCLGGLPRPLYLGVREPPGELFGAL